MRPATLLLLLLSTACGGPAAPGAQSLTQPSAALPASSFPSLAPEASPPSLPATATATLTPRQASSPATAASPVAGATAGRAASGPGRLVTPGPAASSSPGRSPRPAASATTPAPAGSTSVSDADSGKTVSLQVGELLKVYLGNGTWDPPVSSDERVAARQSSTGGYPSSSPVYAVFRALTKGSAELTSTSDAACFHTNPRCLMPTRQWTVHAIVR
jgi:hypothetical protein